MQSRTKGFTLIEMAIVIVILAIMSAVAVPKFIDLSSDAKKAKIASVAADLRIAIDLIYYKALILGVDNLCYEENSDHESKVEGYYTCHGYPVAYISSIQRLLSLENSDGFIFNNYEDNAGYRTLIISLNEDYTNNELVAGAYCQLIYQPHKTNQIVVFDSGC
ncbi:Signal transduction histidine kinase [Moritella sp. JT01]|uniref:type II secretion system protein n=1 Tax=Moritella sp. JT01 TaxID=756698 RepID=UPI0007939129|nr:type II secretion system protein [Moritella sp. JT01]KXO13084.1 Signal transduction histidine kinase [Moritella sp. JT01]